MWSESVAAVLTTAGACCEKQRQLEFILRGRGCEELQLVLWTGKQARNLRSVLKMDVVTSSNLWHLWVEVGS